ncbi:MAG TPA: response regulator [bacterium]|nr:response regulator [bacterium]
MGQRILVVDDEKLIRELLRHKLVGLGFEVVTAGNAEEFSKYALDQKPDLIILDIWLKNRMGPDVYQELLGAGFDREVPVIFITALTEGEPKSTEMPPWKKYALYSKPFDFEKLAPEIHHLLNREKRMAG